jgi:hypothetical protein
MEIINTIQNARLQDGRHAVDMLTIKASFNCEDGVYTSEDKKKIIDTYLNLLLLKEAGQIIHHCNL